MGISTEFYILYGFLAFMSVILAALTVAVIRLSFVVGRQNGQLTSLTERVGRLEVKVDALAETTQRQIGDLNERVAEIRTLIFGINDRINLLMRHRHDNLGRVYLVPEETPAD